MEHKGTQKLETDRLLLRRFEMADAEVMFRNWASDSEVTKFLTWPTHTDVGVSRTVTEDWVRSYSDNRYYQWAIVLKDINEPVGSIAAVKVIDDLEMVEIGYCIGRKWWHQGITSEALKAVMDFFFDEVGVNRIQSYHDPRNPNSGKVMMKCGLKYEGTLRGADRNNQGICDASYYGLLRFDRQLPAAEQENCNVE